MLRHINQLLFLLVYQLCFQLNNQHLNLPVNHRNIQPEFRHAFPSADPPVSQLEFLHHNHLSNQRLFLVTVQLPGHRESRLLDRLINPPPYQPNNHSLVLPLTRLRLLLFIQLPNRREYLLLNPQLNQSSLQLNILLRLFPLVIRVDSQLPNPLVNQ
jgi:hypothetical protein